MLKTPSQESLLPSAPSPSPSLPRLDALDSLTLLQQDISRTLKSCDHMLEAFHEWSNWTLVTQGQKKLLQKALDGTIHHLEESLSQVELQIRNAANRGDSRAVQSWDLWRAQLRQKRNALHAITQRLV